MAGRLSMGWAKRLRVSRKVQRIMLEGLQETCYGNEATSAKRLATVGGYILGSCGCGNCFDCGKRQRVWLSRVYARRLHRCGNYCGFLVPEKYCGRDNGDKPANGNVRERQSALAIVGRFLYHGRRRALNAQFTLTPSVGTLGTWIFVVNGFNSSL